MSRKISLLTGYWHYWLHAVNEHSLHAPFIFDFYTKVIKADRILPGFLGIEAMRRKLLRSEKVIETEDLGAGSLSTKCHHRKIKDIAHNSLAPPRYARLLYRITCHIQARHVIELGTSLGISTLYLSSAAPQGQVYTLEGCRATAAEAQQNFEHWPLKNIQLQVGNIDQTLPALLQDIPYLDLLYLDANHRYSPTLSYYQHCKAKAHEDSIFILDDIYWSAEMKRAWHYIRQDPDVSLSLDLFGAGIILFKKLHKKQHYLLMF